MTMIDNQLEKKLTRHWDNIVDDGKVAKDEKGYKKLFNM